MKKLLCALAAIPLLATPALSDIMEEHRLLWNTLESAGVRIIVNDHDACNGNYGGGMYISALRTLHICQENGLLPNVQVDYTHEDLDTLRHEAQHVVQDCIDGLGDNSLVNLFDEDELIEFLGNSTLTAEQMKGIIAAYKENGASDKVIILELEAFAVANDISAKRISSAITSYCL